MILIDPRLRKHRERATNHESGLARRCRATTLRRVSEHTDLEEGNALTIDFTKLNTIGAEGHLVVPVAVQDADTGAEETR